MTSTLNVSLRPCSVGCDVGALKAQAAHEPHCDGAPVHIPCPIPRSVSFEVQVAPISQCVFPCTWTSQYHRGPHHEKCPCRPIRVSCSISGKTWEGSEVVDVEVFRDQNLGRIILPSDMARSESVCRERWALVKALLAVGSWAGAVHPHSASVRIGELRDQRDAVFAALADMARAEQATWTAAESLAAALPKVYISPEMQVRDLEDRASSRWLSSYVEHLIEQVGVLA